MAKKKDFVMVQGAIREDVDNKLHIQGSGEEVNRDYGVAVDIRTKNKAERDVLASVKATKDSLAGTDRKYFPMQATIVGGKISLKFGTKFSKNYVVTTKQFPELRDFINHNIGR